MILWAMEDGAVLAHKISIWEVITTGMGPVSILQIHSGLIKVLPLELQKKRLCKKKMWDAIKSRIWLEMDESKKMQNYGEGVDWITHSKDEDYALMACNSTDSDTEQVKTPRENVKSQNTHSQKPKVDKKELGHGFAVRACFVCGSLNHLIRDCDFHEKRMARKADLNNGWNNVHRVNKQNQFVPSAVLTRTGIIPVSTARASSTKNFSTARQSFNRQTVLTKTAMKVNTVEQIVNRVRPANVFHKTHSPTRPFKKTTVLRQKISNQKVNTAKVHAVSTVGGKRETAVKPSAGCNWRPQRYHGGSKYNSGSSLGNYYNFQRYHKAGLKPTQGLELQHFNLFSVSQMCDKKNKVLFTDSECLVLSPEFKLPDENQIENQLNQKVKTIRSDNGTEFKNKEVIEFCGIKGIKREYSNARTPQQNGVAERKKGPLLIGCKDHACTKEIIDVGDSDKEDDSAQDCFVLPIWPSYSSTNTPAVTTDDKRAGPREEEQVFMDDLERLKNQEKEAYEEAEALRKKFETLVIKEGAAKPSSTNIFSTVSTPAKASSTNPLNTASIPVSTASPYEGLSLDDPTHSEEDDSEYLPCGYYQNFH
ncbi:retrovirus-related pol polyprotein from transposon TNT 1-94 [Tanacetum coccineum]